MDGTRKDMAKKDATDDYTFDQGIPMTKVYCKCGRIISLDSEQTNLKFSLRKNVECTECRNNRIAREIEELNVQFAPQSA